MIERCATSEVLLVRGRDDYAFYVANSRKLFWIPLVFGACSAPFAWWTLPVHLATAGLCLLVPSQLVRPAMSVRRFLLTINWAYLAPLLSISLATTILVMSEHTVSIASELRTFLIALFVLLSISSCFIFYKVWDDRLRRFAELADGSELAAADAMMVLTGRGGFGFWRSGAGLSLMTVAGISSSWVGNRFGLDAQTNVGLAFFFVLWLAYVGSMLGQCAALLRYPEVASINLHQG